MLEARSQLRLDGSSMAGKAARTCVLLIASVTPESILVIIKQKITRLAGKGVLLSLSQGRFWVDSLTHDTACLKHVVQLFGKDRVALGTDYPFPCMYSLCSRLDVG